ncbi:VTC domain-containing protein [Engelhardtia mirabilis]|uniref:VTC domain protein n=1 Tax=Engelhardtia mirabilis TaxID=2528011 RepID=A0A518BEF2_9BACT|nr:VTC domain protein [Planctomycetes bacterium Pla133]QDU99672.1 VTC domain protein [Planctomycetes bacterium Pla86]
MASEEHSHLIGDYPDSLRYELKMACQESAYSQVQAHLRLDPTAPRVLYPPRRVQSIYLDTTFGRALEENLAGISHREKIRLRWYGDSAVGVRATLERKVRENTLGWKDTLKLAQPLDIEGVDRVAFIRSLRAAVTSPWQQSLDEGLEPVQWIAYQREYLTTADGRIRITIDRELRAVDLRGRWILSSVDPTPIPRVLVIEAKCAPEDYQAAQSLLSRLPFFVDRCSKFVLASDPDHGPVPSAMPI